MMNFDNGRLQEYLGYTYWEPESGLRLLVGLDYWFKSDFESKPLESSSSSEKRTDEGTRILLETHLKLKNLGELARRWHGLFDNDNDRSKGRKPDYFIKFAQSQNYAPEWLDWAIEKNLTSQTLKLNPDQENKKLFQKNCKKIWDDDRTLRISGDDGIINHSTIVKWNKLYRPKTLAIWAAEVAPDGIKGKRGAPRKNMPPTKK